MVPYFASPGAGGVMGVAADNGRFIGNVFEGVCTTLGCAIVPDTVPSHDPCWQMCTSRVPTVSVPDRKFRAAKADHPGPIQCQALAVTWWNRVVDVDPARSSMSRHW